MDSEMTIEDETNARITTQLALRHSADLIKTTEDRVQALLNSKGKKFKQTRSSIAKINEEIIDEELECCALYKTSFKEKNPKYKKIYWTYLQFDANKPFTRREEHIIPISTSRLSTRRPDQLTTSFSGISVTRHFLERVAMRNNAKKLEEMLSILSGPFLAMTMQNKILTKSSERDGMIYLTQNEYVVLNQIEDEKDKKTLLIKTYIPKSDWSNNKKEKLKPILDIMHEKVNYYCFISLNDFNSKNKLSLPDIKVMDTKIVA